MRALILGVFWHQAPPRSARNFVDLTPGSGPQTLPYKCLKRDKLLEGKVRLHCASVGYGVMNEGLQSQCRVQEVG